MPGTSDLFTREEIEQIVILFRLHLYNHGRLHGPKAIQKQLLIEGVRPAPSISTIKRILSRNNLTYARVGD
jgi:putative transposase